MVLFARHVYNLTMEQFNTYYMLSTCLLSIQVGLCQTKCSIVISIISRSFITNKDKMYTAHLYNVRLITNKDKMYTANLYDVLRVFCLLGCTVKHLNYLCLGPFNFRQCCKICRFSMVDRYTV